MRCTCANCHKPVGTPKGKRYLLGEQLQNWRIFVHYAEIYRFKCRECKTTFYVLSYHDSNINTERIYSVKLEDTMWNLAHKTKPGSEPFSTTASDFTNLAKRDTATVYDKVLKRVS